MTIFPDEHERARSRTVTVAISVGVVALGARAGGRRSGGETADIADVAKTADLLPTARTHQ